MIIETKEIRDGQGRIKGLIEVSQGTGPRKEFSWRLKAANGRVISNNAGFNSKRAVKDNLDANVALFELYGRD